MAKEDEDRTKQRREKERERLMNSETFCES